MSHRVKILLRTTVAAAAAFLCWCVYIFNNPPEGIAVLEYHKVGLAGDRYSITPQEFEEHLAYLQSLGYRSISLRDTAKARKGLKVLPERSVIITFDDGYEDNITTALPVLERYDMTATVFVVVNDIDRKGYMSLEQLKQWAAHGFELGSHTANHLPLTELSSAKKEEEISISKTLMGWKGLKRIFYLSYPNGAYDAECKEYLVKNNYLGAVTGDCGLMTFADDPYYIKRINISRPRFGLWELRLRLLKAFIWTKFGW